LLPRQLRRRRVFQDCTDLLSDEPPPIDRPEPGVARAEAAPQHLPVVIQMLLHIIRGDGNVAVQLGLEFFDGDATDETGWQRAELPEQLFLAPHAAVLINVNDTIVQILLPYVRVSWRDRIDELLTDSTQLLHFTFDGRRCRCHECAGYEAESG
jgi:hypothetical protein